MSKNEIHAALGELVTDYRKRANLTQTALAGMVTATVGRTITQNAISALENGSRWGDNLDLIAPIAEALDIPWRLVQQAMNFPLPDDGPPPPRGPRSWREFIEADNSLSEAAKGHIIDQYGLLQLASKASPPTKHEARRNRKTG